MGGGLELPSDHNMASKDESLPLRIITHNIRYATTNLLEGERPWPERLPNIIRQLHHYTMRPFNPASTIICLQEVLSDQLRDIATQLGMDRQTQSVKPAAWSHVGVGRDDGKSAGEFNPIFYRPDTWDKVHFETIWLSETPGKVSRGWDGGCNRLCTCLILQAKNVASPQTIMFLNTHLDNAGVIARRKGASLIIEHARKWQEKYQPDHTLLTGDLNSTQDEVDGAWQRLNAEGSGFVDVKRVLDDSDVRRYGDEVTYTGFDGVGDGDEVGLIDFVHYGIKQGDDIAKASDVLRSFTVVPNLFDDGVRCSDHRAVVVDLLL